MQLSLSNLHIIDGQWTVITHKTYKLLYNLTTPDYKYIRISLHNLIFTICLDEQ